MLHWRELNYFHDLVQYPKKPPFLSLNMLLECSNLGSFQPQFFLLKSRPSTPWNSWLRVSSHGVMIEKWLKFIPNQIQSEIKPAIFSVLASQSHFFRNALGARRCFTNKSASPFGKFWLIVLQMAIWRNEAVMKSYSQTPRTEEGNQSIQWWTMYWIWTLLVLWVSYFLHFGAFM